MEHFILKKQAEEYRDAINFEKHAPEIDKVIEKYNVSCTEAHSYHDTFNLVDSENTSAISVRANLVIDETKINENATPACFKISYIYQDGKVSKRVEEIPRNEARKYFDSRDQQPAIEKPNPSNEKTNDNIEEDNSNVNPTPSTSKQHTTSRGTPELSTSTSDTTKVQANLYQNVTT